jgi:hypothetical protein
MEILFGILSTLVYVLGVTCAAFLGAFAAFVAILFVVSAVNGFVKGRPTERFGSAPLNPPTGGSSGSKR